MAKRWYAVRRGRATGVFPTWEETEPLVKGYPGALFRGFATLGEAMEWLGRLEEAPLALAEYVVYTDGSLKGNLGSMGVVVFQGEKPLAQAGGILEGVRDVGEVEARALLLALSLLPSRVRAEVRTDRLDLAQAWAEGGDPYGIMGNLRALARAREIALQVVKVPRKMVEEAHRLARAARLWLGEKG